MEVSPDCISTFVIAFAMTISCSIHPEQYTRFSAFLKQQAASPCANLSLADRETETQFILSEGEDISLVKSGFAQIEVVDIGVGLVAKMFRDGVQFNVNELQAGQGSVGRFVRVHVCSVVLFLFEVLLTFHNAFRL